MKRFSFLAVCVVLCLASFGAVASAQGHSRCSTMAGAWAYTKTGTLLTPSGSVLYAAVGKLDIDHDGTLTGAQDSNTGGAVSKNTLRGSGIVQDDCTVTTTVGVYDAFGTTLLRTAVMTMVMDDNGREARGLVTQLTLGSGVVVPQVITVVARRIFNNFGGAR